MICNNPCQSLLVVLLGSATNIMAPKFARIPLVEIWRYSLCLYRLSNSPVEITGGDIDEGFCHHQHDNNSTTKAMNGTTIPTLQHHSANSNSVCLSHAVVFLIASSSDDKHFVTLTGLAHMGRESATFFLPLWLNLQRHHSLDVVAPRLHIRCLLMMTTMSKRWWWWYLTSPLS